MSLIFKLLLTVLFIVFCISMLNGIESIYNDLAEIKYNYSQSGKILDEMINKQLAQ
jgi:succinate dehydrogenase/fumarate reductase cytochrome b subunit